MPHTQSERRLRQILAFVLVATILGGTVDLILDRPSTLWSAHVLYELLLISAALVTMVVLWRGWWMTRLSLVETRMSLEEQRAERDAWRASAESALAGLGRAIDERFQSWGLTPTEREIALLLLKGKSHKEIAYNTGRSERTVRQHAVAVYEKSRLAGRAELAAFFLEDLLVPRA
jgi:DNA-binding CsgD family transcriptional regulator